MVETCQMGKVVQHHENIFSPSPDQLGGVAIHQTLIATPISNEPQRQQLSAGAVTKKYFFIKKLTK